MKTNETDNNCVGNVLLNQVVKMTNQGYDYRSNRKLDWSVYRGRAVEYIPPMSNWEKRVGGQYVVVWFGRAVRDLGKTSICEARDLALA